MDGHHDALLLIGPTGSGKTPLGLALAARGLKGRRCVHFDFGARLRQVVAHGKPDNKVTIDDIRFLRQVLKTGALLEDRDFPIARRLLESFLAGSQLDRDSLVVLNGLPRHIGQADALRPVLNIRTVVLLQCSSQVVLQRIATNRGGDRDHRTDDDLPAIERKLKTFAERTSPLIDYFRSRQTTIAELMVAADTTARQMCDQLESDK